MATDGSTIANQTAMVQQLCFENKRLWDQLADRRLEFEDLHDDLRMFLRDLSAKSISKSSCILGELFF